MFGFLNGGMNGGMNGGPGPGSGGSGAGVLPFDGTLELTQFDTAQIPVGTSFPKSSWSPDLRAQLILGEFGGSNWRQFEETETIQGEKWQHVDGFTIAPPPLDQTDNIEAELAYLLERSQFDRSGARMAEIARQADYSIDYWTNLLSLTSANKPATMTLMASGFAIGQMVGMYFKDFFSRSRPAHHLPSLMTVLPTPNHPSFPSNHALQNELVGLMILRCLPDKLKTCYGDAIRSLGYRIGENREIAGLHFTQDSDAGRQIANWLDRSYIGNLGTVQSIVSEARDEWHVSDQSEARNLPYLNPINISANANTPVVTDTEETQ